MACHWFESADLKSSDLDLLCPLLAHWYIRLPQEYFFFMLFGFPMSYKNESPAGSQFVKVCFSASLTVVFKQIPVVHICVHVKDHTFAAGILQYKFISVNIHYGFKPIFAFAFDYFFFVYHWYIEGMAFFPHVSRNCEKLGTFRNQHFISFFHNQRTVHRNNKKPLKVIS